MSPVKACRGYTNVEYATKLVACDVLLLLQTLNLVPEKVDALS